MTKAYIPLVGGLASLNVDGFGIHVFISGYDESGRLFQFRMQAGEVDQLLSALKEGRARLSPPPLATETTEDR